MRADARTNELPAGIEVEVRVGITPLCYNHNHNLKLQLLRSSPSQE